MYRDERTAYGLAAATPWDIGGPQPVVQQLVALGAVKGEVLDPAGPGHHAIYYASKGHSATGMDPSPSALERARQNARKAGVSVNLPAGRRQKLEGLDDRFDTVVDCAFYHVYSSDRDLQLSYAKHCTGPPKPGRGCLYMFEFGEHSVNGFKNDAVAVRRTISGTCFRLNGWRDRPIWGRPPTWSILSVETIEDDGSFAIQMRLV